MIFSIRVILHKDTVGKQPNEVNKSEHDNPKRQDSLVLSIDKNGGITKFNEECERIFGYRKNEVLNRNVTDFLIPSRFLDQWNYILEISRLNKTVDNLKIPFLTKSGEEIIVYWSNFPVKNEKGDIIDIGFVGNLLNPHEGSDETIFEYPKPESNKTNIEKLDTAKEKIKIDDYITKVFRKIKSENEDLLNKNRNLENRLKEYEGHFGIFNQKQIESKIYESYPIKNNHSLSHLFIGKKKKQEFENIIHELDVRKKYLDEQESKLLNEKMKIDQQISDFIVWREKLELLNDRLKEKSNELEARENSQIMQPSYENDLEGIQEIKSKKFYNDFEMFDKIQDSAAIIQRGILRHVNSSFANLVGFGFDEIIDKSLFDFIVPEGFSDIERFYLSRLKGEDVSSYETVILTKDNNKINIEVDNKPTFFKGEKAEIAIVKILKKDDKK